MVGQRCWRLKRIDSGLQPVLLQVEVQGRQLWLGVHWWTPSPLLLVLVLVQQQVLHLMPP